MIALCPRITPPNSPLPSDDHDGNPNDGHPNPYAPAGVQPGGLGADAGAGQGGEELSDDQPGAPEDSPASATNPGFDAQNRIDLDELRRAADDVRGEIGKLVVGQREFIDLLIASLLAGGHVLVEGVPGIAKTLTARLLAQTIAADYSRIQFTPDLMPSDVTGTTVFNMGTSEFAFTKGPIFSNIVLIDEINRAPAKTQAALFEVMAEGQVTVDGHTYEMPPAVLHHRYAKPDRTGGYVPVAGSSIGSLSRPDRHRLPEPGGGTGDLVSVPK